MRCEIHPKEKAEYKTNSIVTNREILMCKRCVKNFRKLSFDVFYNIKPILEPSEETSPENQEGYRLKEEGYK